jgi:glutathione S-transferase
MPRAPAARAVVRQLMLWSGDYLAPPWKAWMAQHFQPGVHADDRSVRDGRDGVAAHLDVLAARLATSPWLAGDAYTLADVCYAPFTTSLAAVGLADLVTARPPVAAWIDRLDARPAVRDTAPTVTV